jgi:hypothetical protein
MPAPIEIKYRAFISYSHIDARWAEWLHRSIEAFRIDKDLAGRVTATGPIPNSLRPVFRDRDEFTAGHTIDELTRNAIEASAALIVLCSPAAVASRYVDLETRLFKSRYPDRPVIPVIVDGRPGDPQAECLPDALRHRVEADGSIGPAPEEILAGDLREGGDGRELVLAKVLAGLLGLSTDDVFRRARRAQAKARRNRNIIAASLGGLFLAAAIGGLIAWNRSVLAQRERGLKLVSAAYELLYRDPSAAVLKAYRASTLLADNSEWQGALDESYKVAVLHHLSRRENQITGGEKAGNRWKQGEVFSKSSPNGRYRVIVTERTQDKGPPGDIYLLNNESMRTTRLAPCVNDVGGIPAVSTVGFDQNSRNVFVTRAFYLSVYSLDGACVGKFYMGCCTKSDLNLVEGYLANRFALVAETKGGLWLVEPKERFEPGPGKVQMPTKTFHHESDGDPALTATLSPDRRRAAVVFESGRTALVSVAPDDTASKTDFITQGTVFAGFVAERSDRLITTSEDGWIRQWDIGNDDIREVAPPLEIRNVTIDWIAFPDDDKDTMLAVGDNRKLYVIDRHSLRVLTTVGDQQHIDWAAVRSVPVQPVETRPESVKASESLPRASLKVIRSFQTGSRNWLVAEQAGPGGVIGYRTYLADGDGAISYPGLELNAEAAEQFGDLYWIKVRNSDRELSGAIVGISGNDALIYSRTGVRAVAARQDKIYFVNDRGLFAVSGSGFVRTLDETAAVQALLAAGERLYIGTRRGGYVLEKERLVRLTEPFVDVRAIRNVGGQVWLVTRSGDWTNSTGPAYLVEGYFADPLPNQRAHVEDVVERDGRTLLQGGHKFSIFGNDAGPSYEVDLKTREATQIKASPSAER